MTIWRKASAHLVLCTALLVFAGGTLIKHLPDDSLTIDVELSVSSGGTSELFVNVDSVAQHQQTVVSAGPQTLVYHGIEAPVHQIRVDPVAIQGATVTVRKITVLDAGGSVIAAFSGPDFATWAVAEAGDVKVDDTGMTLTTATADSRLASDVDVPSHSGRPAFVTSLRHWLYDPWLTTGIVLGLPILILGVGLVLQRRLSVVPVLLGPLAVRAGIALAGRGHGVTPADRAFGHSGWFGNDASYPQHFLVVTGGLVAVLCLVTLALTRQLPLPRSWRFSGVQEATDSLDVDDESDTPPDAEEEELQPAEDLSQPDGQSWPRRLWRSRWPTVLCVPLLYSLIRLPSAHDVTASITGQVPVGYDFANIRTWDHFFAIGLRPMVDFWYPYGNLIYLRAGVVGALLNWVGEGLCLVVLALTLRRLTQRALPVIVGTAAFAVLALQFSTGGIRYWIPLTVVAWFATTRRVAGREACLALSVAALAPFVSIDVGLYTLLGVLVAIAVDELSVRGLGGPSARRRLLRDGTFLAVGWLEYLIGGLVRGGLGSTLSLILDQRSTTAYVGVISSVRDSIRLFPRLILYTFPFAAIGLGLYAALRRRFRTLEPSAVPAVTGIGIFGMLVLGKHLIRPDLTETLAGECAVLLALGIAATWDKVRASTSRIALGALAGVLVLQLNTSHSFGVWRSELAKAPDRVAGLVGAFTWNRHDELLYHPDLNPSQMTAFPEELAAADAIGKLAPGGRIFVLGDSQYLYPLTGSKPYWMISVFNMSPISDQRHVLSALGDDPPKLVVFDRRNISFDGVPNVLRTPLVYRWVIEHYALTSSVGPFDLLRPRQSTEPIDWTYWQQAFGASQELARLPAAATASGGACDLAAATTSKPCVAYLTVDVAPTDEIVERSLSITGPSGDFTVTFRQDPGDRTLRIPLGRLWFWTDGSSVVDGPADWIRGETLFGMRDTVLY